MGGTVRVNPRKCELILLVLIIFSVTNPAKAAIARGCFLLAWSLTKDGSFTLSETALHMSSAVTMFEKDLGVTMLIVDWFVGLRTVGRGAKKASPAATVECLQSAFSLCCRGVEKCFCGCLSIRVWFRVAMEVTPLVLLLFGHNL